MLPIYQADRSKYGLEVRSALCVHEQERAVTLHFLVGRAKI